MVLKRLAVVVAWVIGRREIGRRGQRKEVIDIEKQKGEVEVAVQEGEQLQVEGLLGEEVKQMEELPKAAGGLHSIVKVEVVAEG